MDIKDFILIGGGLLIAAVVAHGFWIAWRARRDPLRIDLLTDIPPDDGDDETSDLRRLRAELPNGGARVVARYSEPPEQAAFPLDEDLAQRPAPARKAKLEPRLGAGQPRAVADEPTVDASEPPLGSSELRLGPSEPPLGSSELRLGPSEPPPRAKVSDVILPERTVKAEEPKQPRRWSARRSADGAERPSPQAAASGDGKRSEPEVQELIVINVIAPKGKPFVGGGMIEALRARGLKYGEMNIFHRIDPMSKATLYSVANVVEPGTFDMADLDGFRSPGVCFFMQLPGPEQPLDAFEDMLKVSREVAVRLGGELRDEQRSVMTGQTVEHYRARIVEFCRRRMSMRA
jgi:cell division protein ZipA